ncbi:unnamed protein product, partial [Brassica rapa subsp. trilocularis]
DGDKGHFSLEKDGEIETRPGEPTSKIIPQERYGIMQQEEFSVYSPEISDKLTQPSKTNKDLIIPSKNLGFGRIKFGLGQINPRCWSGKRRAGSALYLGAGGEDAG